MNVLFATQSTSLRAFHAVAARMAEGGSVARCGFTAADRMDYAAFMAANPSFENSGHVILKEWEVTGQRRRPPDPAALARYERELGEPGLFGAIVADRRLLMGPDCAYTQDYRRRFGDDALLSILLTAVEAVEKLFDELRPDLVVGFICVSILEYVVYLFARARGIPYRNLRPAKVGNTVILGSTLAEPTPELAATYARVRADGSTRLGDARGAIERTRTSAGVYEGVVAPSARPAQKVAARGGPLASARRFWSTWRAYHATGAVDDNHCPDPVRRMAYLGLINPVRARRAGRYLRDRYVRMDDLAGRRYAFFPLHTEPEVSLLVYARPLVNQIEVVRQIAFSLPADMLLVVKEHPWMVGKRSLNAYRKLLEIPRVRIAAPDWPAGKLAAGAALTTVITSSVGQEAAMLRRPVLTLGHCPFNLLPDRMVRRCGDLTALSATLRALLDEHAHDEAALEAYVAAVLEAGVDVNWYTNLLGRGFAHVDECRSFDDDIGGLADHLLTHAGPAPRAEGAAPW